MAKSSKVEIDQAKFGFNDKVANKQFMRKGIDEKIVRAISELKNEPEWMLDIRLNALKIFQDKPMPSWGTDLSDIKFDDIHYYASPITEDEKASTWDKVPDKIKETFDKIGISEAEKKFLSGASAQYDSEVVYHNLKREWEDQGVIFTDMDTGLKEHPEIVKKYFSTLVPASDNKFAALNTAAWSGGSFVYVPKGVNVKIPLQAYFRINTKNAGQFERTLIIAEEGAIVHYIEGCFTKGAVITTSEGEKPIEEIKKGEQVLTHKGRMKKVYHTQVRKYTGNLNHIKYLGDTTQILHVTDEHPFLAVKKEKLEYRNGNYEPKWVEAKNLGHFDYLAVPIVREIVSEDIRTFKVERGAGRHGYVNEDVAIQTDKDFFRLAGYYLSEGSIISGRYLAFTFNKRETAYIQDVKILLEKFFNKTPLIHKEYKNGIGLVLCSTKAARIFAKLFGKGAENKHIPDWMMRESADKQTELIKAYWRGDGNYLLKHYQSGTKQNFRMNTISIKLAKQVKEILLRLDIFASLNVWKKTGNRKTAYCVSIGGNFVESFAKLVDFSTSENIYVSNGLLTAQKLNHSLSYVQITKDYVFVPIREIVKESVTDIDVYNFSVEEDESYIADGVAVHNCSAPVYSVSSLHSAVVEVFAKKNSHVRYTTIQNWSKNVHNLVTKRSIGDENSVIEWLDGNIGAQKTMKYPCIILRGEGARGDVLSVAFSGKGQIQDAGAKIYHLAPNTKSRIISKSICQDGGRSIYRGLVKIAKGAKNCKSFVQCDAYLLDKDSISDTYPNIQIDEKTATLGHEAKVGRIGQEKLFYLLSRGIPEKEALAMIVLGFIDSFTRELPLEYAVELNRLIEMELEGAVG